MIPIMTNAMTDFLNRLKYLFFCIFFFHIFITIPCTHPSFHPVSLPPYPRSSPRSQPISAFCTLPHRTLPESGYSPDKKSFYLHTGNLQGIPHSEPDSLITTGFPCSSGIKNHPALHLTGSTSSASPRVFLSEETASG